MVVTACIPAGIRLTFLASRSSIWRSLLGLGLRLLGSWREGRLRGEVLYWYDDGDPFAVLFFAFQSAERCSHVKRAN